MLHRGRCTGPTLLLAPALGRICRLLGTYDWATVRRLPPAAAAQTVVVHGTADRTVPIEDSRQLVVANPRMRLKVYEGGSHGLNECVNWDELLLDVMVGQANKDE